MVYAEKLKKLEVSMKWMDIGNTEPFFTKFHMTMFRLDSTKPVDQ